MATFCPTAKPVSLNPLRKAAATEADSAGDLLLRNPITGSDPCCALPASGHIAAPPKRATNSRLRMRPPKDRPGHCRHTNPAFESFYYVGPKARWDRDERTRSHASRFGRNSGPVGRENGVERVYTEAMID